MTESFGLWPLVVYMVVSFLLVVFILVLSHFLGPRHDEHATHEIFESGVVSLGNARFRLSAKFYLIAMFFVVFDLEAVFIYAWAVAFREAGWPGYIEVVIFIFVLVAALAYLWRIGALEWGPQTTSARRLPHGR
jgi:NADH-quinone oxidoreductase subunit A